LWWFTWWVALDGPMPCSVSVDPDHVTGDTNYDNNVASGTVTPTPPAAAVEYYAPRVWPGWNDIVAQFEPSVGTPAGLDSCFGIPTSHSIQQVIAAPGPDGGVPATTSPFGLPASEIYRRDVIPGTYQASQSFTVRATNVRVNADQLRLTSWAHIDALRAEYTQWTQAENDIQSTARGPERSRSAGTGERTVAAEFAVDAV